MLKKNIKTNVYMFIGKNQIVKNIIHLIETTKVIHHGELICSSISTPGKMFASYGEITAFPTSQIQI